MSAAALERSYLRAEHATAVWARSFYFASRFLPIDKKRAIFALYDYCRHADNLVDARGERTPAQARSDLEALRATVRALHAGHAPGGERWLALADTLRRYEVPLDPLLELLDGVAMDLQEVAFADYPALYRYCRLVAGGVGLMLGPVLGAAPHRFREPGIGLGVAMQLTNVLRDVAPDLALGRVYLPADELAAAGVRLDALVAGPVTDAWRDYARGYVARARRFYETGERVVPLFPSDGSALTVRLMARTYAGILDD
ncbi:MAG TPA: squalene/phytoene synthase family protein, partial [Gemmatimonadales bacterium]|nr:squalene/phytoene synthase family protein [Gemmatimonadales bacterium]